MQYLHTCPIGSHGHLTSSNCIVDKRWTCKITDYGMANFKQCKKSKVRDDDVDDDEERVEKNDKGVFNLQVFVHI